MTQQKLDALRQTLQQYESGELSSDLFQESPQGAPPGEEAAHLTAPSRGKSGSSPVQAEGASIGQDQYTKARAVVLRKLTGSAKSRHQLAEALRERDFDEAVITAVLDRMEEVQLVDDESFARIWARTRHELKGLGASALRRELREKGVSAENTEAALEQLTVEDEDAAARELIESQLRGVVVPIGHGPEDRKEWEKITRRLVGMLGRRGHNPGAAFSLVREALERRAA